MPDERDRRPGSDLEVEVVQDLGQLPVSEVDVLEGDSSVDRRELERVRVVDHLRILVQYGEDPVERGGGREERVVELGELLDRVEEVREVEREREERAEGHVPVDHEPAAEAEHDGGGEGREHVDRGEVDPAQDDRLVVRRPVPLVDTAEGRLARGLPRERLHDPHPRDVLGERRGDDAEPLADASVGAVGADPEPGRGQRP